MKHVGRTLVVLAILPSCGAPEGDAPRQAPAAAQAAGPAGAADPVMDAVRTLLRHEKERIDGVPPPASWPEEIRRVGDRAWVVDIDTSQLPGGYPEQLIVELSATGGHTGNPKR